MRVDAVFSFDFTYENWLPVVDGNTTNYVKAGSGNGLVVPNAGAIGLVTKDALTIGSQIRNLMDRTGKSVLVVNGIEYPLYVNTSEAQFSPFSELIGWKHALKRTKPRDTDALFDRFLAT